MRNLKAILAVLSLPFAVTPVVAAQVQQRNSQPIYTVTINVVDRTTKAINYRHRSSATKIDFRGTALLPAAHGNAKVESKQGYIEIDADFQNLQSATRFGPEFLTYVMWTITPEGRATNIGEVILNGSNSKLDVTTELQAFGLVVTAEPYFGVTQPSDVVVMENVVRADTVGKVEEIDAKYELLPRGQYTVNVPPADLKPMLLDKNTPLDLYEARNAVRIARWAGADASATESFAKASKLLDQAEAYKARKAGNKPVSMTAREAVQTAEDARLITLKSQAAARLEQERAVSAGREADANAKAAMAKADAQEAARTAATAQAETERTRLNAQQAAERAVVEAAAVAERSKADADARLITLKSQADARLEQERAVSAGREAEANAKAASAKAEAQDAARTAATAQAETERTRLNAQEAAERAVAEAKAVEERTKVEAELAVQRSARDRADADAASQQALKAAGEKSELEKQELRKKLVVQLNLILQTRDTARGLIVNISDVQFGSGQFSLKPGAREMLAKISGILLAYPSLKLEVEGHTDSVGSDDLNMKLSENRANSVRDFLIHEGIVGSSIASHGFGKSLPVSTNDTPTGRQQNRRVELIVSGDMIGTSLR